MSDYLLHETPEGWFWTFGLLTFGPFPTALAAIQDAEHLLNAEV